MLITPILKDKLLLHIVENYRVGQMVVWSRSEPVVGIDKDSIAELINYFVRLNLLSYRIDKDMVVQTGNQESIIFWINIESHDLIFEGGFQGRYELLKDTIQKLLCEVEKLEKSPLEIKYQYNKIGNQIKEYLGILAHTFAIKDLL